MIALSELFGTEHECPTQSDSGGASDSVRPTQLSLPDTLYGQSGMDGRRLRRGDGPKVGDIQELHARAHEVLRLAFMGHKHVQIAEELGITAQSVSQIVNSRLGQEKLTAMQQARDGECVDVMAKVQRLLGPALAVYEKILEKDNEHASLALRKKTADTVLMDLGGFRAPTRVENTSLSVRLSRNDLEDLKRRGREAARAQGILIDITPGVSEANQARREANQAGSAE